MRTVTTVLGLVILAAGCSPGAPDALREETAAEVRAAVDRYIAAVEARDTAAIRALFVDDGRFVWIEDGRVRYRSADDVMTGLALFPPDTPIRTELADLTVTPLGRSGAHAFSRFTTTVGEAAGAFAFGGAISFLLERRDGEWRIVGGHVSSPRPGRDAADSG